MIHKTIGNDNWLERRMMNRRISPNVRHLRNDLTKFYYVWGERKEKQVKNDIKDFPFD